MSDKIRLLPDMVANQIAAGEVVNRPASVVKEMVENAIDAGAKSITVNYRNGGKDFIRIVDDGEGMSPTDARLAFDKHATSKISTIEDVYALHTFGFRGEALASIAAIASVELVTRRAEDELGTKIMIEGGRIAAQEADVCAQGSQFTVRNLFFNVPARRRALDKSSTEPRYIAEEFRRVALCNPDVEFALYGEDAPIYNVPPGNLKQRIVGLIGKNIFGKLLDVDTDTSVVKIRGYVGNVSTAKQTNREQYLFVNGRYFRSPYLHKAIIQAYDKLIPVTVQPSYFIYLEIEPDRIDVNIHPQKTEVNFEDGTIIWQILHAAVREALAKTGAVSLMEFDSELGADIPVVSTDGYSAVKEPSSIINPNYNPFAREDIMNKGTRSAAGFSDFMGARDNKSGALSDNLYELHRERAIEEFEGSVLEFIERGEEVQSRMDFADELLRKEEQQTTVLLLAGGYVGYRNRKGELVLADLRRAKEAILYERYLMMLTNNTSASQKLLFPELLTFSNDDLELLSEQMDEFVRFGFEYSVADDNRIEITGIPADFVIEGIQELLYDLIDAVRDGTEMHLNLHNERLATVLARRGSQRMPEKYTRGEIEAIVDSLSMGGRYNFTPDGRAVLVTLPPDELKRLFAR